MARFAGVIAVGIPHHINPARQRAALYPARRKRIEKSILIYYGKARNSMG
jgi:hypothetical protein